jgi:PmbA protein
MNDADVCQTLVRLCRKEGASDATASVWRSGQCMVRFSNNQVTVVDTLQHRSGSLFVNMEGRRASIDFAEFDKASLGKAIKKAVAIAQASPPAEVYAPLPKGPFAYDPNLTRSPHVTLDPDDLVSWAGQAMEAGLREGAERMAGSLIARDGEYTLATSGDVLAETDGGSLELSVRAFGKGEASGASVLLATKNEDLNAAETGREAGAYAKMAENPARSEPGAMDAVLGPMVTAALLNQVGRMASAFYLDSGMTFLVDKLDREVSSPEMSLYDDPTLAGSYGAMPFDAEGLPTRKNAIIDQGVLNAYLHNSTTAKKFGVKTTANAGMIAPRPFNLVMEKGSKSPEDLISGVDDGILVTNNWYLRYQNYSTGDFSTIPRDALLRIKNGQLDGPVKDLRMSDNMLRILQNIDGVTADRRWIKWWEVPIPTLSPSVLVRGLKFTRSTQ